LGRVFIGGDPSRLGLGGLSWGRPFQPPATLKQAANGQTNYRNSVDRSELVWSTSVGGPFQPPPRGPGLSRNLDSLSLMVLEAVLDAERDALNALNKTVIYGC
jgi:hypothetical protein